ncbi:hypothetical protein PG989_000992 [Apiospora arundinis]
MVDFVRFKHFLPEVRCMIWRHALEEESSSRIILIHSKFLRIMPCKLLTSPFLLTSQETRTCAKEFYDVQINIYALPHITLDLIANVERWRENEIDNIRFDGELPTQDRLNVTHYWDEYAQFALFRVAEKCCIMAKISQQTPNKASQRSSSKAFSTSMRNGIASLCPSTLSPRGIKVVNSIPTGINLATTMMYVPPNSYLTRNATCLKSWWWDVVRDIVITYRHP